MFITHHFQLLTLGRLLRQRNRIRCYGSRIGRHVSHPGFHGLEYLRVEVAMPAVWTHERWHILEYVPLALTLTSHSHPFQDLRLVCIAVFAHAHVLCLASASSALVNNVNSDNDEQHSITTKAANYIDFVLVYFSPNDISWSTRIIGIGRIKRSMPKYVQYIIKSQIVAVSFFEGMVRDKIALFTYRLTYPIQNCRTHGSNRPDGFRTEAYRKFGSAPTAEARS